MFDSVRSRALCAIFGLALALTLTASAIDAATRYLRPAPICNGPGCQVGAQLAQPVGDPRANSCIAGCTCGRFCGCTTACKRAIKPEAPVLPPIAGGPPTGLCVDGTVTRTINGDTIEFTITRKVVVQLDGCYAPEPKKPGGPEAAAAIKQLAEGKSAKLFIPATTNVADSLTLNRVLGRVWVTGQAKDLTTLQIDAHHATGKPGK